MATKRGIITQSGADAFTQAQVATGLTADGKTGWEIVALTAYWSNGDTVAAGDVDANAILSTVNVVTTFDDTDEITRINWATQNTGGIAVAYPMELIKRAIMPSGGRLTVQPTLYLGLSTTGTSATNTVYFEIEYNIVKLSDLDVLRLLQGGV